MGQKNLENFGGFQKARELWALVVEDVTPLARHPVCARLVGQQIAAADSICANIEEGYGRGTKKEFRQFLIYSRGSAREVRGRYERMNPWFSTPIIAHRVALCDEILGILTTTIKTLRA